MGWWIALAILVGLAILPLGVSVKYNADGVYLAVIAGPIRIKILPAKKKDKKPKKEKKPKKTKKAEAAPVAEEPKTDPQPVPESAPASKPAAPAEPLQQTPQEKYPELEKKPEIHKKLPTHTPDPEEKGGSWKDFLSLIPVVLDFLGDFRRKLRVNRLEMRLTLAGDDPVTWPSTTAGPGRRWATSGPCWSVSSLSKSGMWKWSATSPHPKPW